ncbi:glycosyltransferase [Fictibacillus iocasae]|uniref:Glycosyltransferase n=1 Tax=Fictibacillus iocasae TaxID=2715437 RepID=A0ABW2NLT2_9BACL
MKQKSLNILTIPSFYPQQEDSIKGIFFKEQANLIARNNLNSAVIYSELRSVKKVKLKTILVNRFQTKYYVEDKLLVLRNHSWNYIPTMFEIGSKIWVYRSVKLARKYIEEYGKPDIIHAHCALFGGYVAKIISQQYNIPYIVTEHSSGFPLNNLSNWQLRYARDVFDGAAGITVVSNMLKKSIQKYTSDQRKEIIVIPNFIDTNFFTLSEKKNNGSSQFIFSAISRLDKNKGIDLLIKAFVNTLKNKNVLLYVAGEGPEEKNLKKLVSDLGMENKVIFTGVLDRTQVRDLLWKSDCLVSTSEVETFGSILIEAMSTGLPILSTKSGGPQDIINHKVGILINKRNIEEIGKALFKMYSSKDSFNRKNIREYILSNFGPDKISSKIINLYEEIIIKRQG